MVPAASTTPADDCKDAEDIAPRALSFLLETVHCSSAGTNLSLDLLTCCNARTCKADVLNSQLPT